MARITINLEPLAGLYHDSNEMARAIFKNATACEIAGADSVMINLGNDSRKRKIISSLIETLGIGVTVRAGSDDKSLESLIDLRPAMAMIPFQADRKDTLSTGITNLQIENVLVGMEVPIELDHVKEAARLKCDYVILNCEQFCSASSINAQLEELNKISKLAVLASRLSLGAIVSGDFNSGHLARMKGALAIEEIIMGIPFFSVSLIHGYSRALEIARFALS